LVGNGKAGFIRSESLGQLDQPRVGEATAQANKAFPSMGFPQFSRGSHCVWLLVRFRRGLVKAFSAK